MLLSLYNNLSSHPQVTFSDGTVSKNHWVRRLVVCVYGMSCLLIP